MSTFLPFWALLVLSMGTMLLGFQQGNVIGWIGGIRIASQTLAGAFPALVCVLSAGLAGGGFRWRDFFEIQGFAPYGWLMFSSPFAFLAFIVFILSGLVLMSVPPLDGALSAPDIRGGVTARLYGSKFGLFRLARYYGLFFWLVIAVVLFAGSWRLPEPLYRTGDVWFSIIRVFELVVLIVKVVVLMLLLGMMSKILPRLRTDQITDMAWKVLGPLALMSLLGTAVWVGAGGLT